jgi:hypothetical protein
VPVGRESAGGALEFRVYRSAIPLPADPPAVRRLLASGQQLELVATLDDAAFKRHRQWREVEAALGIKRE